MSRDFMHDPELNAMPQTGDYVRFLVVGDFTAANIAVVNAHPDLTAIVQRHRLSFALGFIHQVEVGYVGLHSHATFELVFHPTGSGHTRLANGSGVDFIAGDAVLYAPWQRHDQTQITAGDDLCLQIGVDGPLPSTLPPLLHLSVSADPWLDRELRELAAGPVAHNDLGRISLDHRAAAVMSRMLAQATTYDAVPEASAADRHAADAHRWITEHFRDIGRLEEVAERVGIGYDHLRHSFRRRYGRSLVRWLMEVRIERAKELLVHAPMTIADISRHVGYATPRHFSAVFKAIAGTTPAEFRCKR